MTWSTRKWRYFPLITDYICFLDLKCIYVITLLSVFSPSSIRAIFLLMAAVMASEQRAYRSAPVTWAGQRSTTCCRSTAGSSWNLKRRQNPHVEEFLSVNGLEINKDRLTLYTTFGFCPDWWNWCVELKSDSGAVCGEGTGSDTVSELWSSRGSRSYFLRTARRTCSWETRSSLIPT